MLVPCKECGKEISSTAKSCPHCGVVKPVKINKLSSSEQLKYFFSLPLHEQIIKSIQATFGMLIIIVILVAVFG